MIGNDVVDLKQAEKDSNWERPRFLDKVFTESEQQLIFNSEEKNKTVWLLWSMKEAAYKIHVREYGKRFFNPKKLECFFISFEKGRVTIDNDIYFTNSLVTENYVYAMAVSDETIRFKSACFPLENSSYKSQSASLKKAFLKAISKQNRFFKIKKNAVGVPQLYFKNDPFPQAFSLTHHGVYGGYAVSV